MVSSRKIKHLWKKANQLKVKINNTLQGGMFHRKIIETSSDSEDNDESNKQFKKKKRLFLPDDDAEIDTHHPKRVNNVNENEDADDGNDGNADVDGDVDGDVDDDNDDGDVNDDDDNDDGDYDNEDGDNDDGDYDNEDGDNDDDDVDERNEEEKITEHDLYQELNLPTIHFSNRFFLESVFEKVETDCKTKMTFRKNQFNKRGTMYQFEEMFDTALVDTLFAQCANPKNPTPIENHPTTQPAIRDACINTDNHTTFMYIAYNPTQFSQHVECTFQGVKNYLEQLILGFIIYTFPECTSPNALNNIYHVRPNEVVDIKYVCSSKKVGAKLMLHLMNNMKKRGKRLFILEEASRNGDRALINFYESLGFQHVRAGSGAITSWKKIRKNEEQFYMTRCFIKDDNTVIRRQARS